MAKSKLKNRCCNPFSNHQAVNRDLRLINSHLVQEAKRLDLTLKESDWICNNCNVKILHSVAKQRKRENVCCNPLSIHGNNINKKIREVNTDVFEKAKKLSVNIQIGQSICDKCRLRLLHLSESVVAQESDANMEVDFAAESSSRSDEPDEPDEHDISVDYTDKKNVLIALDNLLKTLNMNAIDESKLRNKWYQANVFEKLKMKLLGEVFTNVSDYQNEIIEQIKGKFGELTEKSEKLKLLSVLPQSWSANKMHNEIGVTKHIAKRIKKLVRKKGIFFNADKKIGRHIGSETIENVINFYRDDEISKVMPGMRDCIVHKDNMEKVKLQRRLLLFNLREVHELFRKKYPNQKIGFSKFATLRPRECVTAFEKYGTHTVCVCPYHQNCKLMIDCLNNYKVCNEKDYKVIINLCLCKEENRTDKCYTNQCSKCPGIGHLINQIQSRLEEEDIDRLKYKQWVTVGGKTSLEDLSKESDDFLEKFREQIEDLIPHNYIAQRQSQYLKWRQEYLMQKEILLIYDFSENYTCIIQDAVQSYHWSPSQVTIFPICMYFKDADHQLKNQSVVIVSENTDHNFTAVYAFQRKLITYLKQQQKFQHIEKLVIFSDGAPTQFKNKHNFYNTCLFKEHFGLDAELHFFATSHGLLLLLANVN